MIITRNELDQRRREDVEVLYEIYPGWREDEDDAVEMIS